MTSLDTLHSDILSRMFSPALKTHHLCAILRLVCKRFAALFRFSLFLHHSAEIAAFCGDQSTLKVMYSEGCDFRFGVAQAAALMGHTHILDYLFSYLSVRFSRADVAEWHLLKTMLTFGTYSGDPKVLLWILDHADPLELDALLKSPHWAGVANSACKILKRGCTVSELSSRGGRLGSLVICRNFAYLYARCPEGVLQFLAQNSGRAAGAVSLDYAKALGSHKYPCPPDEVARTFLVLVGLEPLDVEALIAACRMDESKVGGLLSGESLHEISMRGSQGGEVFRSIAVLLQPLIHLYGEPVQSRLRNVLPPKATARYILGQPSLDQKIQCLDEWSPQYSGVISRGGMRDPFGIAADSDVLHPLLKLSLAKDPEFLDHLLIERDGLLGHLSRMISHNKQNQTKWKWSYKVDQLGTKDLIPALPHLASRHNATGWLSISFLLKRDVVRVRLLEEALKAGVPLTVCADTPVSVTDYKALPSACLVRECDPLLEALKRRRYLIALWLYHNEAFHEGLLNSYWSIDSTVRAFLYYRTNLPTPAIGVGFTVKQRLVGAPRGPAPSRAWVPHLLYYDTPLGDILF